MGGIEALVWEDCDRDGGWDPNEPPLEGALVELFGDDGAPVAATAGRSDLIASCVTGTDGTCSFFNLPAGAYWLAETNPHGLTSSTSDRVRVTVQGGQFVQAHFGDWTWRLYLPLFVK